MDHAKALRREEECRNNDSRPFFLCVFAPWRARVAKHGLTNLLLENHSSYDKCRGNVRLAPANPKAKEQSQGLAFVFRATPSVSPVDSKCTSWFYFVMLFVLASKQSLHGQGKSLSAMLKAWKLIAGGRARHERYQRIERFVSFRILKGCKQIYPNTLPMLPDIDQLGKCQPRFEIVGAGTPPGRRACFSGDPVVSLRSTTGY